MHHLHPFHHLAHHYKFFLAVSLLAAALPFAFLAWRYLAARKNRPKIAKTDVVYQESFASGLSQKNALTRVGGATNCLRLVVTKEILWIRPWFPFSLLAEIYDLEHIISLRRNVAVQALPSPPRDGLLVTYTDERGASHSLKLYPKNRDAFLRALSSSGVPPVTVLTS